jgi:hypothetical protein
MEPRRGFSDFLSTDWRPRPRLWVTVVSLAAALVIVLLALPEIPSPKGDSYAYIALAEGQGNVVRPFSQRVLHPAFVRLLSEATGLDIHASFCLAGIIALVVFTLSVTTIFASLGLHPVLALPVLLTPFLLSAFILYYFPDLMHAALVGVFFLLYRNKHYWWGLPVLLALVLTRESTALLTLAILYVALKNRRYADGAAALAVTALGFLLVGFLTGPSANRHALSTLAYLPGKVLFNFSRNVLGFPLWTNTLGDCEPLHKIAVPGWLPSGSIHTVGVCAFNPLFPLRTFAVMLTIFGTAPTILAWKLHRARHEGGSPLSPWILLALVYGLVSFLAGPVLGAQVGRLCGYGWPAFWLAMPALAFPELRTDARVLLALLALSVATCWVIYPFGGFELFKVRSALLVLVSAAVMHLLSIAVLKSFGKRAGVPRPAPLS